MIQKPKGTYDVFGEKSRQIKYIEKVINSVMEKYNYEYMKTPVFESSELFHRGVGETTDIVTKETYDFVDRGGRSMTLRPEGTAGICRSYGIMDVCTVMNDHNLVDSVNLRSLVVKCLEVIMHF